MLSVCFCQIITTQVMSIISAVTTAYCIGLSATAVAIDENYYDWTYECVTLPDGSEHCESHEERYPYRNALVSK